MPFEAVATEPRVARQARPSISYMRQSSEHRAIKNRLPRLNVSIPRAVLGAFKPNGTTTYEFHIGTGKDVGKARIVPGKNGVRALQMKHCVGFRFGYVPKLGDEIADREYVEGRPVEGGYEIDLPAWFK